MSDHLEFLKRLPYFSGLPPDVLVRLCGDARELTLQAGDTLLEQGRRPDAMYVVMEGKFETLRHTGQRDVVIGTAGVGEVLGEMSLLEDRPASASARALVDSRVIEITRGVFRELLKNPTSVLAMLKTVTHRLRATEGVLRQEEKMAALGKLTAGLMHELNNPAAAVRRSAAQLVETLESWQRLNAAIQESGIRVQDDLLTPRGAPPAGPLERADIEQDVATWLEQEGVEEAWELAPALIARGWNVEALEEALSGVKAEGLSLLASWAGRFSSLELLARDLRSAAQRISEIVASVKNYSRLDEAPLQDVDLHAGLEDTLRILHHKLGKNGVRLVRDYDANLPHIEGYASELNQVWTNLIDNAVDAMGTGGELTVRTRSQNGKVAVEVSDTGAGIPADVQERIFDPFFTTKPPGEGTGLGLHTSYNIVLKHGGEIRASSEPGGTTFKVVLPLRPPRAQG